jgi:hypothetical protein
VYLAELAARLRAILGDELGGVYAGGSYALGDYEPGRSDIDVAVVAEHEPARETKERIVGALRHESLPCPARGLELVLYERAAVARPTGDAAFALNLNTGATMPFRADFAPGAIAAHWFAIDRSILADRGVAIAGPPAAEVFAAIPREVVLPIVAESVRWHADGAAAGDDAVLNACRAWRFAVDGVWSSKPAAGEWAQTRSDAPVIGEALAARRGGRAVDSAAAAAFVRRVADKVARAATQ